MDNFPSRLVSRHACGSAAWAEPATGVELASPRSFGLVRMSRPYPKSAPRFPSMKPTTTFLLALGLVFLTLGTPAACARDRSTESPTAPASVATPGAMQG